MGVSAVVGVSVVEDASEVEGMTGDNGPSTASAYNAIHTDEYE